MSDLKACFAQLRAVIDNIEEEQRTPQPEAQRAARLSELETSWKLLLMKSHEMFCDLNREEADFREEADQAKSKLQNTSQQLNHRYELEYLQHEIFSAKRFQSAVSDEQLGLVPVDEFWAAYRSKEAAAAAPTASAATGHIGGSDMISSSL